MTTIGQKRPLILLHKCPECTTFALTALPAAKFQRNVDSLQQRLARFRLNSAPATITENVTLGSSLDDGSVFEEDEAPSAIERYQQQQQLEKVISMTGEDNSSGTSGHSSLEDSPVARPDSPSPRGQTIAGLEKTDGNRTVKDNGPMPARLSKALRHRSVSECEGIATSPIKGILKRPSIHRSLSECANESMMEMASSECLFPTDAYISESGDDEIDSDQQQNQTDAVPQSPSFKKTVRFNDLVQQTLFRPNSSILGHKKRHDRKQQQQPVKVKRKRTYSNSSNGSDSRLFSEIEVQMIEEAEPGEIKAARRTASKEAMTLKSDQRRQEKKNAMFDGNSRYAGFQIGRAPIDSTGDQGNHHRRHASGDSALGDDEEDCETGQSDRCDETGPSEASTSRIRTSVTKDSGMEDYFVFAVKG